MTTSSTSLTIRERIQSTIDSIFERIQRNAEIRRRVEADRMDYPWQRPRHCEIHHVLMRWSITLAQKIKPQSELDTAQCFVCDLCEREKKQKQIDASFSLSKRPDYRPGILLNAANQATVTNQTARMRRIALASISTHDLLPAPLPSHKINPVTPLPETRHALFSDVPSLAESLILWPDEKDEDAMEMRKVCMPKKRDTVQIPVPHVEELLYRLMHVPTHEQSTDENEQLQLQQRERVE